MKKIISHKVLLFLACSFVVNSCSTQLDLDINEPDALIVVDGWIEQGDQAKVFLTTNSPYFSSIDSASLRDLVLSRAKVTLSDGENTEVLILRKDSRFFPPYYYEGNTIYGETGKTYILEANYGGKSIISQTSIPRSVKLDTAYFKPLEENDSIGYITLSFSDPPDEKNYYTIFTRRENKDDRFIASFIIAIDDQYFNGKEATFSLALPPKSFLSTEENTYFKETDTVHIKLCTMDKESYDFWSSYQDEVLNASNPFASSMIDLKTNIMGEGLGIWGGYGVSLFTVNGQ